jgi:hypothetical protein
MRFFLFARNVCGVVCSILLSDLGVTIPLVEKLDETTKQISVDLVQVLLVDNDCSCIVTPPLVLAWVRSTCGVWGLDYHGRWTFELCAVFAWPWGLDGHPPSRIRLYPSNASMEGFALSSLSV